MLAGWFVVFAASVALAQTASPSVVFPAKGMVTLVDLGATECIPCKMMAPILRDLAREYEGKAAVIFIDVWKNPAPARQTGIRVIPTQIFYDKQGKEVGRHEGFLHGSFWVKRAAGVIVGLLGIYFIVRPFLYA